MTNKDFKGFIGLDLDGTVFNNKKQISDKVIDSIKSAIDFGFVVAPVTGRPTNGLPVEFMEIPGVTYAITANGATALRFTDYKNNEFEILHSDLMKEDKVIEILEILEDYVCVPDCFVNGRGHMPTYAKEMVPRLGLTKEMTEYILSLRDFYDDLKDYVRDIHDTVEKITINFYLNEDGLVEKERAREALLKVKDIKIVSGAKHNLEINNSTVGKGEGILRLCEKLSIPKERTCAIGDDENDLDMIVKTGFGVAMDNASDEIKKQADFVTLSNEDDGVAMAIERFIHDIV